MKPDATLGGVSAGCTSFSLLLGLSSITVLADANASLGIPSITMRYSCSQLFAYILALVALRFRSTNLLLDPEPQCCVLIGYEPSSPLS